MNRIPAYAGQVVVYAALAMLLGTLSQAPAYRHFPEGQALIKLSFTHGAGRKSACRRRTAEELAKLAPNMRKKVLCPRERLPVVVELDVDARTAYRAVLPPTGLSGDGPSRTYTRISVPAGMHDLVMRLRDSAREEGFDYQRNMRVDLAPGQSVAIDFRSEAGGFILKGAAPGYRPRPGG